MYSTSRKYQLCCPECLCRHEEKDGKIICTQCGREFIPPHHPTPICGTDVPMDLIIKASAEGVSAELVIPWEDSRINMSKREFPLNCFNELVIEGDIFSIDGERTKIMWRGGGGRRCFEGKKPPYVDLAYSTAVSKEENRP